MNQLFSQLQTIATLYAEVLMAIVAAGVFGVVVGLLANRSRHSRQLAETTTRWQLRCQSVEETARSDASNLEEQLQTLASETKSLQTKNRALADTIKKLEANSQKARAENIELSRERAESIDKLQQVVQQKDLRIAELAKQLNLDPEVTDTVAGDKVAEPAEPLATALADNDLDNADTVAIIPSQLSDTDFRILAQEKVKPIERIVPFDDARKKALSNREKASSQGAAEYDPSLDETADLSEVDPEEATIAMEEATIAMDEEALASAQQVFKSQRGD